MWVNLKYILLTEKSQPEKTAYYMIPIMLIFGKGKTINSVLKKISGCQGFRSGRGEHGMQEICGYETILNDSAMVNL